MHECGLVRLRAAPLDDGVAGRHVRHARAGSCRSCCATFQALRRHRPDQPEPRPRPLHPLDEPIARWEDLVDWRRLQQHDRAAPLATGFGFRKWTPSSGRGSSGARASSASGNLDEAFVPTEWDEADLAFRIREAGWKVATCGYERLGGYEHLGSSTLGELSDAYKARVLKNGLLFHSRWSRAIARDHARSRRTLVPPDDSSAAGSIR